MKVLITGTAGFIGFHAASRFLKEGHSVIGFDGFTDYYDPKLKRRRDEILQSQDSFISIEGMLENAQLLTATVEKHQPELVIHLAAQAGVRYSIESPATYISSNIEGTFNLLEALRNNRPRHFLFASTSSVYGGNRALPFRETDATGLPMSLYASTKSAGETMSHSYAHLFGIPTTCFRFFTVYGPWGRPDMALFKFVERMMRGDEIEIYGNGEMSRDFTYIDDLVEAVRRLSDAIPPAASASRNVGAIDSVSPIAPWRVVNIAGGQPVLLSDFVSAVENAMGVEARKKLLPMQPGDVSDTLASTELLYSLTKFLPNTPVARGVESFVEWYSTYQRDTL